MTAIIDYKAGNAPSVMHAVKHLEFDAIYAHSVQEIEKATHIILPGVASARATMDSLRELDLIGVLEEKVLRQETFFLGICVGMQILFEHSEEEDTDCLGWLGGNVVKFDVSKTRVPQMGWNKVAFVKNTPVNSHEEHYYFVNSFHARPADKNDVWGTANYPDQFTAAVSRENIYATQFHAEKSGKAGLALLSGFLSLKGGASSCLQNA